MIEKWKLTEQKYDTPGDRFIISVVGGGRICQAFATDKDATLSRGLLIAAAPELLGALVELVEIGLNRTTVERAIKAIDKATKPAT